MGHLKIAILPQFLTSNVHFVRKGCGDGLSQNRNFTSVFDVQRPFRAKGRRWTKLNRNFTSVFDVQRPFRAKALHLTKLNRNFTSVFDVRRPFRAKGLRFVALRRHCPRLKREIERRARGDVQM